MGVKVFTVAWLFLVPAIAAAGPLSQASGTWEFEMAGGPWTMSPFRSPVERETEAMLRDEFARLVDAVFLERIIVLHLLGVDLDSSGKNLSLGAWHTLSPGTFSLGLRLGWSDYRIPFQVSSRHGIAVFGLPLGELEARGDGEVRIRSAMVSALARWNAFKRKAVGISLYGGVAFLPFRGTLDVEGTAVLRTPLGDITVHGSEKTSLEDIRKWNPRVPACIAAPVIGITGRVGVSERIGLLLDASFAHGTVLSAGLFLVL